MQFMQKGREIYLADKEEIKYISPDQVAKRWNVSSRLVRKFCAEGRVEGAIQEGRLWRIPEDAKRPSDNRVVTGEYKRPSKKEQLVVKGLLKTINRVLLLDLENDRVSDVTDRFNEEAMDGVYSRNLERYIVSGEIFQEDVQKVLAEATITNLRLKLATQEKIEIRCRCKNDSGDYVWRKLCYTVCERKNGIATYAVLTFDKIDEGIRDKDIEKYIREYSYTIRTSVNSMMGMLEIEEKMQRTLSC